MLPLDIEQIKLLFDIKLFWGFTIVGLINAILMLAISYKYLQMIQQCSYKGSEYFKWLARKDNAHYTRLQMLSLLSIFGFLLTNMALSFIDSTWVKYSGFILYFLFLVIYFKGELSRKEKLPLVITKRMIRLMLTFSFLVIIFSLFLIYGINLIAIPFKEHLLANFRYAVLCLCPMAVPYLLLLAYYINEPFERKNNAKYIRNCKQKLGDAKNLIKIGITGSFGKTSIKEILKTLLSEKYNVLSTPASFNTPLGICKTVNRLTPAHDVFIAEMGARRVGEIKELTEIVKPDIAVLTGITNQHLETFKLFENIKKTKYEIIDNMRDGRAVFNADNPFTCEMYNDCTFDKRLAGTNLKVKPYVYATDVKIDNEGTTFTLFVGKKSQKVSTCLLGSHNVSNICMAVAVADYLGISFGEICAGISRLKPASHRLQLIKGENGVTILDDTYNANSQGVKYALETLKCFSGKKVVVTPGLVEVGLQENAENFSFGLQISKVADYVILIGRARSLRIREGLIYGEFNTDNIYMAKDLEDAKKHLNEILNSGDVVLFENDLPDKYN